MTSRPATNTTPLQAAIDLVIFDCDGVLVDSEPLALRVLLQALSDRGLTLDYDEAVDLFLGRSMASISRHLADEFSLDFDEAALEQVRLELNDLFTAELQPIADVAHAIDALDTAVCVASSSQPERIAHSLTVAGLHDRLHPHLFSATMVQNGKPAPDLFLYAASQMGVSPAHCLVIEDSPAGIMAAKSAGMRVLAFTGGGHASGEAHRANIAASGADLVFENMRDLNGLVAQLSSGEA